MRPCDRARKHYLVADIFSHQTTWDQTPTAGCRVSQHCDTEQISHPVTTDFKHITQRKDTVNHSRDCSACLEMDLKQVAKPLKAQGSSRRALCRKYAE